MMLNEPVAEAVRDIEASFKAHRVECEPDGQGGVFIRVHDLPTGPAFSQTTTWIGFQITFPFPFADIYPHYLRSDLSRKDGNPLAPPLHLNNSFPLPSGPAPSVMLSRRSNNRNPATETASVKLAKILDWLRSQ